MSKVQFATGRILNQRVTDFLVGRNKLDDVYDLLDDIQLAYNDGLLCDEDYENMIAQLEDYIE